MNKKILALAIPNIISNISIPLVSTVDTILMGHLSALHLAALGIVSMIFLFLYGTINFLRQGTTGMVAQAFGANNHELMIKTLYRALLVALLLSFVFLIFKDKLLIISFYLMNVDESYQQFAQTYFQIRILAVPAVFMLYVLMGWFFGIQNAIYPLIITIIINVLNIALSYYFVNVLNMGIEGAAYGTVIAQYTGLIVALIFLFRHKTKFILTLWKEVFEGSELLRFFKINANLFIRTSILTFSLAFFYSQAAKNGEETLTIMILLLQFVVWFSYSLDGFANAAESLVGRYYGANDWKNFDKTIKYVFVWGLGLTLVYMMIFALFGKEILSLYTNQREVIEVTMPFLPYVIFMPLLSFMAYIWDGVFVGMTATRAMRNITIWSMLLFLFSFHVTKDFHYEYALWASFMLFLFARGAFQTLVFFYYGKNLK